MCFFSLWVFRDCLFVTGVGRVLGSEAQLIRKERESKRVQERERERVREREREREEEGERERERAFWRALVAPHSPCQILWCVDSSVSLSNVDGARVLARR